MNDTTLANINAMSEDEIATLSEADYQQLLEVAQRELEQADAAYRWLYTVREYRQQVAARAQHTE